MTRIAENKNDSSVVFGFLAAVALAVAISTLARGSTTVGVISMVIAIAITAATVMIRRQPTIEIDITDDEIRLTNRRVADITVRRERSGEYVTIGQGPDRAAGWFLSAVEPSGTITISLFGFNPSEVSATCQQHGWQIR